MVSLPPLLHTVAFLRGGGAGRPCLPPEIFFAPFLPPSFYKSYYNKFDFFFHSCSIVFDFVRVAIFYFAKCDSLLYLFNKLETLTVGVRRVSPKQASLHPIENPFRSGTQRREIPIPSQCILAFYHCISKVYDLKFCVTE